MNTILDIAGSVLISAAIMFILLHLNVFSNQQKFASDKELEIQRNSKTIAEIMDHDLRKIGYRHPGGNPFIVTQEKVLKFYSDIDSNNVVDIITYSLSDSTADVATVNPRDKILLRTVNADTGKGPTLGLVDLKFTYLNHNSVPTAVQDSIRYVRTEIWVQSSEPVNDTSYIFTYWEMTIHPRNIKY
jgi:hypothetical protein